jgi:hypothetical protein
MIQVVHGIDVWEKLTPVKRAVLRTADKILAVAILLKKK